MDKITVTDSMKLKIISEAKSLEVGSEKKNFFKKARIKMIIPLAACIAILAVAAVSIPLAINKSNLTDTGSYLDGESYAAIVVDDSETAELEESKEDSSAGSGDANSYEYNGYSTSEELSRAVGFDVSGISSLDSTAQRIRYFSENGAASIVYEFENMEIEARKYSSLNTDVLAHNPDDYNITKSANIHGSEASVYGYDNSGWQFIIWEKDGFIYEIFSDSSLTIEEITSCAEQFE